MLNIFTITSDESDKNIENLMIKVIASSIFNSKEFQKILLPSYIDDKKKTHKESL